MHSAVSVSDVRLSASATCRLVRQVKNPNRHHPVTGEPVSYAIIPGVHTARLMANSASAVFSRAPFCAKNLWVTPHHDRQSFPAGEYVMQARAGGSASSHPSCADWRMHCMLAWSPAIPAE